MIYKFIRLGEWTREINTGTADEYIPAASNIISLTKSQITFNNTAPIEMNTME